ncbi:MAG: cation transporter [Nanohaloarchaea archaeon SW_7_43_1]|nr:MAG: cation transporter [Nanohaloarchaea archaeon SW_7_43_1]
MASDYTGLSQEEAEKKLEEHGSNELKEENKTTKLDILVRQVKGNFLIWILLFAAGISYYASIYKPEKIFTFYFIIIIVGILVVTGFIQEWKAEEAMKKLKDMQKSKTTVVRNGKKKEIPSENVVPGDILKLERGDSVPADAEILESNDISIDEATLTGESEAVSKEDGDEIYSGTTIVFGKCTAKVTATGMDTELGKIADQVQGETRDSPLKRKMNTLAKRFAAVALVAVGLIMTLGFLEGADMFNVVLVSIALAVASVPEGLPLALTLTLSYGMRDMAEKNAIVKKMLAVEGLGSTTVICTDKTGTLTRNEMTIQKVFADFEEFDVEGVGYVPEGDITQNGEQVDVGNRETLRRLVKTGLLCNNSELVEENGDYGISGEPTEASLVVLGEKLGTSREEKEEEMPREDEILFTSERKMMTTVNKVEDRCDAFTKGAPEFVLEKCSHIMIEGERKELTEQKKQDILEKNKEYANDALRVLALAYREDVSEPFDAENIEEDLTLLGLAGMIDPARENVKDAIETSHTAGVDVKMVTGDNPRTAKAIAEQIGLVDSDARVMTGDEIEEMDEEELMDVLPDVEIYARTKPEHKNSIVSALQDEGEIVAMTGDGVNDAPAVKNADVGVGMGQKGTDVTKEASDVILEDDNFGSIVSAVEDGRRIYDNIEKFTTYLVSRNFAEIITILAVVLTFPYLFGESGFKYLPLIALQILFINVVEEELPSISLGLDPAEKGIMKRMPRPPDTKILNSRNLALVSGISLIAGLFGYLAFIASNPIVEPERARTVVFATSVLTVVLKTFSFRSLTRNITEIDLLKNKLTILSAIVVLPAGLVAIYFPQLARSEVFGHQPPGLEGWMLAVAGAVITVLFIEAEKVYRKRKK